MQVVVPSTPAQVFHMLRRQMLRKYRKPLVVMSPKSLLRTRKPVVLARRSCQGSFLSVIGETRSSMPKKVTRVLACSGKVYYELLAYRREKKIDNIAIIRLEQQYPFPHADFTRRSSSFPAPRKWCGCRRAAEPGRVVSPAAYLRADTPERWCSRTPAAPSRRRRRSATRRSTSPNRSS
jgi:2-oxoglutarate dehydrogenase E1 component